MKDRILEATYACIGRAGLERTTVEDAAREAGVSRATVYRWFPGGRQQLIDETIAWETDRFFARLAEDVDPRAPFVDAVVHAIVEARRWVVEHELLQHLVATEPGRLLPALSGEVQRLVPEIGRFVEPWLRAEGVAAPAAVGEYVARMVVSHISSPGRWDLEDPAQVRDLVETEIAGPLPRAPGLER